MRRWLGGRRGSAIVETAVVMPLVILLVLGMAEAGRMYSAYMVLQHASREGARLAISGASYDAIRTRVLDSINTLNTSQVGVQVAWDPAAQTTGSRVAVTVTYPFQPITPLLDQIMGRFNLRAITITRVE